MLLSKTTGLDLGVRTQNERKQWEDLLPLEMGTHSLGVCLLVVAEYLFTLNMCISCLKFIYIRPHP